MKRQGLLAPLVLFALAGPVLAGTQQWTAEWGMGISEYHVSDGQENELVIVCPDDDYDGPMRASATINGQTYRSTAEGENQFDVIVDGERYSNPFYTDCRVCNEIFRSFWEPFREASQLAISAGSHTVSLPTTNLSNVLHPLESELNACRSSW